MEYSDKSSMNSIELQLLVYEQLLTKKKQSIEMQIALAEKEANIIVEKIASLNELIEHGEEAKAKLKKQLNDKVSEREELRQKCISKEEELSERKEQVQKERKKLDEIKTNCNAFEIQLKKHSENKMQTQEEEKKLSGEIQKNKEVKAQFEQYKRENEDEFVLTKLLREHKFRRNEAQALVKDLEAAVNDIWNKVRSVRRNDRMLLP